MTQIPTLLEGTVSTFTVPIFPDSVSDVMGAVKDATWVCELWHSYAVGIVGVHMRGLRMHIQETNCSIARFIVTYSIVHTV